MLSSAFVVVRICGHTKTLYVAGTFLCSAPTTAMADSSGDRDVDRWVEEMKKQARKSDTSKDDVSALPPSLV